MQGVLQRTPRAVRSVIRTTVFAAICTVWMAGAASVASAQKDKQKADTAPNPCNPNAVVTPALVKSTFLLQRAFQTANMKADPTKDLREAINLLTSPPPKKEAGDSIGRAYYLAQAYLLMMEQPSIKPIGQRKSYGIATDTLMTVDLLAAVDTSITRVEQVWPAQCRPELEGLRQRAPWVNAINGSIAMLNAGNYDSAEVLAKRSLVIMRTAPYAYSVLASIESNRKQYDSATVLLKKVIELSSADPAYKDAKYNAMYDMANTATMKAQAAAGPQKRAAVQEAITAWHAFIPLGARDAQIANAEQTIVHLLKSTGDSTSLQQAYAPIIADPSKFGEQALLNAGLIAVRAKHQADAAKLFEAVLDQNPNQRDAINNLAASYVGTKDTQKMFPLIDRLVALDPNNPDNWLLYAYAYTGLLKNTKDPKLVKAYTDSLVKYNNKSEKLPTRVTFHEFSHMDSTASGPASTTLSGTIENRAAVPKSYALEVEFLDKAGKVVATQTVNVGPVPGHSGTKDFSVTVPSSTAVAFRYKPLS